MQSDRDIINKDQSFCVRLKSVTGNKNYLLAVASISFLYYIITGIQYWVSDYMIRILGQSKGVVFIAFGIVSITGPVGGVIVGGNITTALGGYSTKKSI
jgi:sugar phosphate permease